MGRKKVRGKRKEAGAPRAEGPTAKKRHVSNGCSDCGAEDAPYEMTNRQRRGEIKHRDLVTLWNANRNPRETATVTATSEIPPNIENPCLCAADAMEFLRRLPYTDALSRAAGGPELLPQARDFLPSFTAALCHASGMQEDPATGTHPGPSEEAGPLRSARLAEMAAASSAPTRPSSLSEQDIETISAAHDKVMADRGYEIFRPIAEAIAGVPRGGSRYVRSKAWRRTHDGRPSGGRLPR